MYYLIVNDLFKGIVYEKDLEKYKEENYIETTYEEYVELLKDNDELYYDTISKAVKGRKFVFTIDEYNKLIDTLKAELLEDGFIYSDKTKAKHQQKCRDKDLSYLGNAIASMEDASIPTMKWYFNNGDMIELTLEEMKGLRANGAIFLSIVFGVEAQMKTEKPTKNITLEMFKDKVDAISQVKCWRA